MQLDKDNSTVSTIVTPQQVEDLPLPNRNILTLTALVPGAAHGGTYTNVNTSQITFNGSRALNGETLLDGQSVIEGVTGQISPLPSPDALAEFRVLTSNAPAEYGRTSGSIISLATRAGTNSFHGGVYYLFRNEALDANNYFNNARSPVIPRSRDRYNQFGGTIGGPIRIPHLYNGTDHAFFFFNYDNTVQLDASTAQSSTFTVPTAAYRSGDFSNLLAANNGGVTNTVLYDPQTGLPFPNNMIPANRIDSSAAAILAQIPLPNVPNAQASADISNGRYTANYTDVQVQHETHPRYTGRIDYAVNEKTRIFASTNRWKDQVPQYTLYNNPALATNAQASAHHGWEATAGLTQTFSSKTLLDLRFGLNRWVELGVPRDGAATSFGIGSLPTALAPAIGISGTTGVGFAAGAEKLNRSNTYSTIGSLTKVIGGEVIKVGGILRKDQFNTATPDGSFNGAFNFTGDITAKGGTPPGLSAAAFADFLLGKVKTASYQLPQPETGRRNFSLAFYGQDDWAVTRKLHLNLGVRWEYESPMSVNNNIYSRFDPSNGALLIAGKNASNTLNITTPKLDFSPRVGFQFSPQETTVLRGGFGTYYGQVMSNLGSTIDFPGYAVTQNFNNLGTGKAQSFSLNQGLPLIAVPGASNPSAILATASDTNPISPSVEFVDVSPLQQVQQWNLGVQQEMFSKTILEINYVGSHGVHLPLFLGLNLPDPNQATAVAFANSTKATQDARPINYLGTITGILDVGTSSYNSLQVSMKRQFGSQLSILSNYTWSHNIDDGSGIYNFSQVNGLNGGQYSSDPVYRRTHDRGNSAYDVRNAASIAMQYHTKGPIWLRDFTVAPVFVAQSGFPLTVTQSTVFPGAGSQRPNGTTAGLKLANPHFVSGGTALQYLAPPPTTAQVTAGGQAAQGGYQLQPSGPFITSVNGARTQIVPTGLGSVGRYDLRGVGNWDMDLSLTRTFHLYEKLNMQLRVDAFNVLNHTNFGQPNTSLGLANVGSVAYFNSPTFGQITTALQPRQLQLIGRINF
jgi:hypothetical protein